MTNYLMKDIYHAIFHYVNIFNFMLYVKNLHYNLYNESYLNYSYFIFFIYRICTEYKLIFICIC